MLPQFEEVQQVAVSSHSQLMSAAVFWDLVKEIIMPVNYFCHWTNFNDSPMHCRHVVIVDGDTVLCRRLHILG